MKHVILLAGILTATGLGCGGDDPPRCRLDEATVLADSSWPVVRRDAQNTGRLELDASRGQSIPNGTAPGDARCIFPLDESEATTSGTIRECVETDDEIDTTPIVAPDNLVVGTTSGRVHLIDFGGGTIETEDEINLTSAVNTPMVGANGWIFVTERVGAARAFDADGGEEFGASLLSRATAAPNLGPDGVLYAGTEGGIFSAVCTNGIPRFTTGLGSINSPAATTQDPSDPENTIVLAVADNGRVQAYDDRRGNLRWSFFTAARTARSAVVVVEDESVPYFIVPDTAGFVLAGTIDNGTPIGADSPYRAARCAPAAGECAPDEECADGEVCQSGTCQRFCVADADCSEGSFCLGERITAAPALGREHVYIATEGGRSDNGSITTPGSVYAFALDFSGGSPDWSFQAPAGSIVQSSPAVVVDEDGTEVVVFAFDRDICDDEDAPENCVTTMRGRVYGRSIDGAVEWQVDIPGEIGTSSPSIRATGDGSLEIYVGTQQGHLFQIDWSS